MYSFGFREGILQKDPVTIVLMMMMIMMVKMSTMALLTREKEFR